MKTIFLTNRDKANLVSLAIEKGFDVISIICPEFSSSNNLPLEELADFAKKNDIPFLRTRLRDLESTLIQFNPELLISSAYPFLLSPKHLKVAQYNINIHPSLLPKYRGPDCTWYIIANGETESGVTVHIIDKGMDTGPILVQEKFNISCYDTIRDVMLKNAIAEPIALEKTLRLLKTGRFELTHQDGSEAITYKGYRKPEDSKIDPSKSILDLYNVIRACDPDRFPAFFEYSGKRLGVRFFLLPDDS